MDSSEDAVSSVREEVIFEYSSQVLEGRFWIFDEIIAIFEALNSESQGKWYWRG
jgi:hypothetical protein